MVLPTSSDVIIIGAGMAGITLARHLVDNSTASVIVLEARDRSGGRLYSVPTPYGRIDHGAMWIHDGIPGNPLYDLAVSLNTPLTPAMDYFSAAIFKVDGTPTDLGSSAALYEGWINDVISRIEMLRNDPATNSKDMDIPLIKIFEYYVMKNNLTQEQKNTANLVAHTSYPLLLSGNLTELSTLRYGDAKVLPAIDVFLKDGFDALTNIMKEGIDIRYNTPVAAVKQSPEGDGVTIVAADGNTFKAKFVVTTQSLGCLKAETVHFEPPLPEEKLKAIRNMGMGVLDKVILVYDQPFFWNNTDFISREMPDLSGEWSIFLGLNKTLGVPALLALNAADTARRLENKTDEELVSSLLDTLRTMYPDAEIGPPREYHVTRWANDPWAKGSKFEKEN